jgi:hypothetical protein
MCDHGGIAGRFVTVAKVLEKLGEADVCETLWRLRVVE